MELDESMPPQSEEGLMNSCLYECHVMHRRLLPRRHQFGYRSFWFYLDLDELPKLEGRLRGFGTTPGSLYRFCESDHLDFGPDAPRQLSDRVRWWLETQKVSVPEDARIFLLTLPRFLGYVFNPVSFYFVCKPGGSPLAAIAEVGNTYREQKPYLVPIDSQLWGIEPSRFRRTVPKHFYVSPFSPLDWSFDFRLRLPGERLALAVDDRTAEGRTSLVTRLTGVRRPLTDVQLARLTLRYPWVTLRVIALIHWEAFRLWTRRIPWFSKKTDPSMQRQVLRPHPTIPLPPVVLAPPSIVPTQNP
jgi:DUF1365 family protein